MHPWCSLCFCEFNSKTSEPTSPLIPPCGHVLCCECLMLADEHPCYARCGQTTSVGEARPIRMRFIECGDNNWQELLSSKARKRLQRANATLEELATELDEERAKLAHALAKFTAGRSFETTLQSLADNLAGLEEASTELHPQILEYSKRLEELKAEIKKIKGTQRREAQINLSNLN